MRKYFDIPLSLFTIKDRKDGSIDSMQALSEWVFEWNMDNYGGAYDVKIDDCYYDINEAYEYLSNKTGVPVHELKDKYNDEVESDFRRAMADSFMSAYDSEWTAAFYDAMQENIAKALGDELYKRAFFVHTDIDKHENKVPVTADFRELCKGGCLESEHIRIYATVAQMRDIVGNYDGYTWSDYANELEQTIHSDSQYVNTEYIDYHGTMGDSDEWLSCFKDGEETSATIKKDIAHRLSQTKSYIKNNVPLIYRKA